MNKSKANIDQQLEFELSNAFRRDSSKILAVLIKLYGPTHMMWAEDTLQETFNKAMLHWRENGLPNNPAAWLMLTAKRSALDKLRNIKLRRQLQDSLPPEFTTEWTLKNAVEHCFEEAVFADEELRLLFWVAATDLPIQSKLPLMLKLLCGLSTEAIGRALFEKTETIKKRLQRGRSHLASKNFELPDRNHLSKALESVHIALYLLFNEGINPRNPDPENHIDLCNEAIGLTRLLVDTEKLRNAESIALFSLMHYHCCRLPARSTVEFLNVPLDEQNRDKWDSRFLIKATHHLDMALNAESDSPRRFLLEALIAHEHCRARSFEQTDWPTISQHYAALFDITGSPMVAFSGAVASAHAGKIAAAIKRVELFAKDPKVKAMYQYSATLAYLYGLDKQQGQARKHYERSITKGLSENEAKLLSSRFSVI